MKKATSLKFISKVMLCLADEKKVGSLHMLLHHATELSNNPLGIQFSPVCTEEELRQEILIDGDIQAVIIDANFGDSIIKYINGYRPELCIYILLDKNGESSIVKTLSDDLIDGYFYKDISDCRDWFSIIQAELTEKNNTPFFTCLKNYVLLAKDSWHTPGHSSGNSLRNSTWAHDFYDFYGENIFHSDLSVSVQMLDSLMEPHSVIAQAQEMAARAFGAKRTFFVTNGTSTANKVILQTLLRPGDKILLDRNSHKSIHHAVILSGAKPYYLNSTINTKYGIYGPILKSTIEAAIKNNLDAKALLLTSCTYDGFRYDLKPIVTLAHQYNLKVIVDEAWYSHAKFHPKLRPTALECGADYVAQSTHKVLSAFSQASMIHVNDPAFNDHIFRENLNMHTSTSPQYSMLASLDVARKQMMMEGYKILSLAISYADEIRNLINSLDGFSVLTLEELLPVECHDEGVKLDPTKLTVDIMESGFTSHELQDLLLNSYDIQVEKTTFSTISLLVTIGTTPSKISRLFNALTRIDKIGKKSKHFYKINTLPNFSCLRTLPRDAYYCEGMIIPLIDETDQINKEIIGTTCADQIVPYPPGIPVLVPGQLINEEILNYLVGLLTHQKHIEIHGVIYDGYLPCIRILNESDIVKINCQNPCG